MDERHRELNIADDGSVTGLSEPQSNTMNSQQPATDNHVARKMTQQEAIEQIRSIIKSIIPHTQKNDDLLRRDIESLELAISALQEKIENDTAKKPPDIE